MFFLFAFLLIDLVLKLGIALVTANQKVSTYQIRKMINSLISKIKKISKSVRLSVSRNKYYIVYKCKDGRTKTYMVGDIDLYNSFGNKNEQRDNAGFRAYCFARSQTRSFRHDRIISITKK